MHYSIFDPVLHQIKYYLRHRLKSVHLHGIHSPFIYELQQHCLLAASDEESKGRLVRFRESVIKNTQQLTIEDHGAGSKRLHKNVRTTRQILKHNCSTTARAELLSRLTKYLKVNRALELGTSLGIGTTAIALNAKEVTTIEASPAVYEYAARQFDSAGYRNIKKVCGTFEQFLSGQCHLNPSGLYDLIFIDGHHDGDATIKYVEQLLPYCHDHSLLIIDDIYWSSSMTHAWRQLQGHQRVTASVDTFQWGLLFLRKEQRQQSFYINV